MVAVKNVPTPKTCTSHLQKEWNLRSQLFSHKVSAAKVLRPKPFSLVAKAHHEICRYISIVVATLHFASKFKT